MVQGLPWREHRNQRTGDILKLDARLGNILTVIRLIESDSILNEHIRGLAAAEEQDRSSTEWLIGQHCFLAESHYNGEHTDGVR